LKARDAGADLNDLAGDLMTDDAREGEPRTPGLIVLDGKPAAACQHARHRFAGTGDRIRHVNEFEWRIGGSQHQCPHGGLLS